MAQPSGLRIRGARQNNLKNISLEIPHDRLTVVTGVSGSGKSSLAFDTLFAEGQWRYIESLSTYARMFLERIDRPDVDRIEQIRPAVALEQKNPVRTARSTVGTATEIYDYLRLLYAKVGRVHCASCGAPAASHSVATALREGGGRVAVEVVGGARRAFTEEFRCGACGAALERPQPLLFSFNHPLGACAECKGFGNVLKYDESLVVPDRALSLGAGAIEPWTHPSGKWYQRELVRAARRAGVALDVPWERLGERERQLGSQLVGTLYVLDEPSIGLHARDTARLADLCRELATAGNTVAVVEHDRAFIEAADHVIELGPGSGERGGEVVFSGSQDEFRKTTRSLTARYLTGRESIPAPLSRRPGRRQLVLTGAREHNLKDLTLRLPLGTLTVVTGVSGSGKSTLVHDTLYRAVARAFKTEFQTPGAYTAVTGIEYLKGVRLIDQAPIGRTPRSNPVTYVKAFDEIRKLYAALPRAKALGLGAGAFSFNVPGGRCESCQGDGFQKLEMYFFEDVYVSCQECEGRRYRPEVLGVKHRGKSIADVLALTVDEAVDFFAATPALSRRLRVLQDVGLGYLRLGQPATTLSGGEAQRLKIAAELAARAAGEMLYVLDEPTTGLHLDDIKKLLVVLHRLVDAGNTILLVEHHLDVIRAADWVVDLGPEGGDEGGEIVAEGPPEVVAQTAGSYTGKFLAEILPKNGVPKNGRK